MKKILSLFTSILIILISFFYCKTCNDKFNSTSYSTQVSLENSLSFSSELDTKLSFSGISILIFEIFENTKKYISLKFNNE